MDNIFNRDPNDLDPFKVTETPDELVIKIPWHTNSDRRSDGLTLLFSVGALIVGIVLINLQEGFLVTLFGGVFALVGVLLSIQVFVNIFNTTTITVTKDHISTRNGPYPFTGTYGADNVSLPITDLKQVVTEYYAFGGEDASTLMQLLTHRGKAYKVFQFKKTVRLAKPLEQRIETFIGLADDPNAVSPRQAQAQKFLTHMENEQVLDAVATLLDNDTDKEKPKKRPDEPAPAPDDDSGL
ncbi:MAG: hypothetical protein AAF787_23855 [Chloroflexota bacterium]